MDDLRVELGYGLLPLINDTARRRRETVGPDQGLRRQIASDLGYIMPPVRLLDNVQLAANEYVIKIKEVGCRRGTLFPGQYMVMDPMGGKVTIPGTQTTEPTFGLPATGRGPPARGGRDPWLHRRRSGDRAVDPSVRNAENNVSELLSYADVKKLLTEVPSDQPS